MPDTTRCVSPARPHAAAGRRNRPSVRFLQAQRATHVEGDDGGFTLIETLVALTIFGIVSAAAVLAILTGISGQTATHGRVGATGVAQQVLAQAQALSASALTAEGNMTTTTVVGSSSYAVTQTVTPPAGGCPGVPVTGQPATIVVGVTVTPHGAPAAQAVSLNWTRAC